jgi:hypothetical protein
MVYDWDFPGGEAEFMRALALDPNDATAHERFAENLGSIGGRERDALSEIDQAHLYVLPVSLDCRVSKPTGFETALFVQNYLSFSVR